MVNFVSDVPLLNLFINSGYSRHFPEFQSINHHLETPYLVYYRRNNQMAVKYVGQVAALDFPWELMRSGETILYAAYPFIECQHQTIGVVTSHAAAVSLNQGGIMVLGKIGAGKTSTVLHLCRKFGAKLIANDLCLVGGEDTYQILGGTKDFHIRLESARHNLPDLVPFFPERSDVDSWSNKVVFDSVKLGIELQTQPIPLELVVLVHIDQNQQQLMVQPKSDLVLRLLLNENFSRYIRSTTTTLLGGDHYEFLGYIPSMDTPEFFEKRKRLISYMLDTLGVVYISGRVEDVVNAIAKLARS
ncbi:hypothetical protein KJ836_02060 [Patescibacteria group bacterium]|nr:hypothetical protein [Patescibacteria group bacterium]